MVNGRGGGGSYSCDGQIPYLHDGQLTFTADERAAAVHLTSQRLDHCSFLGKKKRTIRVTPSCATNSYPPQKKKHYFPEGFPATVVAEMLSPTQQMFSHFCAKEIILEGGWVEGVSENVPQLSATSKCRKNVDYIIFNSKFSL